MTEESSNELKVGAKMPDGSIYLGFFNKKDWFVADKHAEDENGNDLVVNFNAAAKYAKNLKAHGHDDWILPPGRSHMAFDSYNPNKPDILNEMFNAKSVGAFKRTYEVSSSSYYWSDTPVSVRLPDYAWVQNFSHGWRGWYHEGDHKAMLRCVRAVPRPL
jgi:hypothetical protein